MLTNISRATLAGAWFASVIVLFACGVVLGAEATTGASELWLVAGLVPPAVILLVWPPAVTVADLVPALDERPHRPSHRP